MLETRPEFVKPARENTRKLRPGKRLTKRNQHRWRYGGDFSTKMSGGAPKNFSMLCCLQFSKFTQRHGFGEHTWVAFSKILRSTSSIFNPIFTFYVVRLSDKCRHQHHYRHPHHLVTVGDTGSTPSMGNPRPSKSSSSNNNSSKRRTRPNRPPLVAVAAAWGVAVAPVQVRYYLHLHTKKS